MTSPHLPTLSTVYIPIRAHAVPTYLRHGYDTSFWYGPPIFAGWGDDNNYHHNVICCIINKTRSAHNRTTHEVGCTYMLISLPTTLWKATHAVHLSCNQTYYSKICLGWKLSSCSSRMDNITERFESTIWGLAYPMVCAQILLSLFPTSTMLDLRFIKVMQRGSMSTALILPTLFTYSDSCRGNP